MILILLIVSDSLGQKSLFTGIIQFPLDIMDLPNIRIYYAGHKITTEMDDHAKKVIFTIPEIKERSFFYLLFVTNIECCTHENTVPFLKLKKNQPYKFYSLQRIQNPKNKRKRTDLNQTEYTWIVKELSLTLPDGRIPDDTIIIYYNPSYIQAVEGGAAIEFPKIFIKPDILSFVGGQQKLEHMSNTWFLAALNTDLIHDSLQPEVVIKNQPKTILAMAA